MAAKKQKQTRPDWWFAMNNGVKDAPKLLLLPNDTLRWQWVVMLCVASQNGGRIPSLKIAALGLRLPESKAALVVAALHRAELLDDDSENGGYFVPHDWCDHQPKRNKGEATAAKRQAEYRVRHGTDSNGKVTAKNAVTGNGIVTGTELELKQNRKDGGGGDAGGPVRDKQPWELEPCHDLARRLAEVAKCGDEFEFTGWGGATYRVKQWLEQGWPEDLIVGAFREVAGRPSYVPPHGIKYFESAVARFIAQQKAPLPEVISVPAKTIEVSNGKTAANSAVAAARELGAGIQRELEARGLDSEPYQPTHRRVQAG